MESNVNLLSQHPVILADALQPKSFAIESLSANFVVDFRDLTGVSNRVQLSPLDGCSTIRRSEIQRHRQSRRAPESLTSQFDFPLVKRSDFLLALRPSLWFERGSSCRCSPKPSGEWLLFSFSKFRRKISDRGENPSIEVLDFGFKGIFVLNAQNFSISRVASSTASFQRGFEECTLRKPSLRVEKPNDPPYNCW